MIGEFKREASVRVAGIIPLFIWIAILSSFSGGCFSSSERLNAQSRERILRSESTITTDEILSKWRSLAIWMDVQHDPVYDSSKRFLAIPLSKLLSRIGRTNENFQVHIRCKDGYLALLSSAEALDGTGYLAFADESSPQGTGFSALKTKSGLVDPAPLYLFWTNDAGNRPRPYQIEEIELWPGEDNFARAKPSGLVPAKRGFELFKKTCSPCHAVNGAGGRVGVDLNIPMNVTEYWKNPVLRRLLYDPLLVRANAKMPALHLPPSDVDDVIAYLQDMQGRKMTN